MFKKTIFTVMSILFSFFVINIAHWFNLSNFDTKNYTVKYNWDITNDVALKTVAKMSDNYYYWVWYFETSTANDFNWENWTVWLFVMNNSWTIVNAIQIKDWDWNKLSTTDNVKGIFKDGSNNIFILEVYPTKVVFWWVDSSDIANPSLISWTPLIQTYDNANMTTFLNVNKIDNNLILWYWDVKWYAPWYKIYDISSVNNIKLLWQLVDKNVSFLWFCFDYPINVPHNLANQSMTVWTTNASLFTNETTGDSYSFKNSCIDNDWNVKKYILETNISNNDSSFDNAFIKNDKIYLVLNNHNYVNYKLYKYQSIDTWWAVSKTQVDDNYINTATLDKLIGRKVLMEIKTK